MATTATRRPTLRGGAVLGAAALLAVTAACTPAQTPEPAAPAPVTSASATEAGTAATPAAPATPTRTASPTPPPVELPRGGREIFPRYRLVGYCGLEGGPTLGRLGTGPVDQRVDELEKRAKAYRDGREILPVLEIIATVVQADPGEDGKYRVRIDDDVIEEYYQAARRHKALLLLNIQPGQSEFLPEVKAYRKWLQRPDVGVALDPEWAMDPGQRPGGAYGKTTGAELNEVAAYLADLVKKHRLPEKAMVYHQVSKGVVRRESGLKEHPGVAIIKSVDGLGPPGPKIETYGVVNETTPDFVHAGFKLFFTEDTADGGRLMEPKEVLALRPKPEYVMYE